MKQMLLEIVSAIVTASLVVGLVLTFFGCASKPTWPPMEQKNYEYGSVDRH
jgi:hypothetical protein